MTIIEPGAFDAASQRLRVAALLVLVLCVFGIFASDFLVASGTRTHETPQPSLLRPSALNEPPFLWLLSAFAVLVWGLARRWGADPAPLPKPVTKSLALPGALAAVAVIVVTGAGALTVMHPPLRAAVLLTPLLGAISILSLAGASARLWPNDARRGRLAIAYLATSTQFLLMSMAEQVWAAHLCINVLWLYLVLRDDRFGLAAAPWVGIAALGLQNPLPHVLLAAPFLLRLLRTRRLGWIGYYAAIYGAGALAVDRWVALPAADVGARDAASVLSVAGADRYFVQGMNLSALLTWQAPAMALFLVMSVLLLRALKPAERDLLVGLGLTVTFSLFYGASEGTNASYASVHPALGSAALLAASATVSVAGQRGGALVPRLVALSSAIALLIQLPLRATQTERLMRPRPPQPVVPAPSVAAPRPTDAAPRPTRRRR